MLVFYPGLPHINFDDYDYCSSITCVSVGPGTSEHCSAPLIAASGHRQVAAS